MQTVIELPEFIRKAEKLFGEAEREKIVEFLSSNQKAGTKIEGFGGIRRLEWIERGEKLREHNIYYHAGSNKFPLVLIGIFRKNERMILDKIIEILIHNKTNHS